LPRAVTLRISVERDRLFRMIVTDHSGGT